MAGQITLLHLQRALIIIPYTQGAASLYPGLCASALTARAGQCHRNKVEGLRSKVEGLCLLNVGDAFWRPYIVLWMISMFPSFQYKANLLQIDVN